jgi:hypothetical protein
MWMSGLYMSEHRLCFTYHDGHSGLKVVATHLLFRPFSKIKSHELELKMSQCKIAGSTAQNKKWIILQKRSNMKKLNM